MPSNLNENKMINDVISSIYLKYASNNEENSDVSFNIPNSLKIIEKATEILQKEQAVLQIDTKNSKFDFIVAGDIHGSLESLIRIFEEKGNPKNTRYLFLGDYVDRGYNSCEVIVLLYAFKCLHPDNIYLIRGNHEFSDLNKHYGFRDECFQRVKSTENGSEIFQGDIFYKKVTKSFNHLPICAILNDSIFCVHGGITSLLKSRDELLNIQKVGKKLSSFDLIQAELMWNDPNDSILTYCESSRGFGSNFGQEALDNFLKEMKFDLVIRGHQSEYHGYNWPFGEFGGILTVFSAIDYCGFSNKGGVAVISKDKDELDDELVEIHQLDKKSNKTKLYKIALKVIIVTCLLAYFT